MNVNPYDGTVMDDDDDLGLGPLIPVAMITEEKTENSKIQQFETVWSEEEEKLTKPHKRKLDETSSHDVIDLPMPPLPVSKKPKTSRKAKEPKPPKEPKDAPLPKVTNTRDRPINRCVLTKSQLPEDLVEFLQPKLLMKPPHIFAKNMDKGPYQGVSPYVTHGVHKGWGAQLQNKKRGQMIRIGTFDDIDVAAFAYAASYIDNDLIDEPLKARDWIEDMSKPENKEQLDDWIMLNSIGE